MRAHRRVPGYLARRQGDTINCRDWALQNATGRPRETNGGEERITASSGNGKGATGSRLRGNGGAQDGVSLHPQLMKLLFGSEVHLQV